MTTRSACMDTAPISMCERLLLCPSHMHMSPGMASSRGSPTLCTSLRLPHASGMHDDVPAHADTSPPLSGTSPAMPKLREHSSRSPSRHAPPWTRHRRPPTRPPHPETCPRDGTRHLRLATRSPVVPAVLERPPAPQEPKTCGAPPFHAPQRSLGPHQRHPPTHIPPTQPPRAHRRHTRVIRPLHTRLVCPRRPTSHGPRLMHRYDHEALSAHGLVSKGMIGSQGLIARPLSRLYAADR